MFNRRLRPTSFFQPGLEQDERWLRYRWKLFTTYTIPSVAAQSNTDFDWVILCNEQSPAWLREQAALLKLPCRVRFSFKKRDPDLVDLAYPRYDAVLTTRIDSDDAWHRCAMERVRQGFEDDRQRHEILNFTTGYRYDSLNRRLLQVDLASPPFSTKVHIAPVDDPLDIGGAHDKLLSKYTCRDISGGEPMFVQVVHGENVRDRLDQSAGYISQEQSRLILRRDFKVVVPQDAPIKPPPPPAVQPRNPVIRPRSVPPRESYKVAVSIPYYQCKQSIRRAVECMLQQTYHNLVVIVVNDGDADAPWDQLAHIDDPRLVRFDLAKNYGRYFADAAVLRAIDAPYFMIQDADDWSEPNRVARLLDTIRREHADGVISAHYEHRPELRVPHLVRFPQLRAPLTREYGDGIEHRLRSSHFGLFRASALRYIGGYYGGFRVGYDTLMMHMLPMIGKLAYLDEPLYHRAIRATSLSHSAATGMGSGMRRTITRQLERMYADAFCFYTAYVSGNLGRHQLCSQIRRISTRHVATLDRDELRTAARSLRVTLRSVGQIEPIQVPHRSAG